MTADAGRSVSVEHRDDGVAVVRIDRPKANALNLSLLAELEAIFVALGGDPPGAVVLTGGERIFSAGADIAEFSDGERGAVVSAAFASALGALGALPRATVAAISGYALGGGLELALACDFRFVSAAAQLGQPEILLGLLPGGGGSQRLARLVGPARAKDIIMTGRRVGAAEALAIGLADRVAEDGDVLEAAIGYAASLASGAVLAQGLAKQAIDRGLDGTLAAGLALESQLFAAVFATEDAATGVAAFRAGAPGGARFVGR